MYFDSRSCITLTPFDAVAFASCPFLTPIWTDHLQRVGRQFLGFAFLYNKGSVTDVHYLRVGNRQNLYPIFTPRFDFIRNLPQKPAVISSLLIDNEVRFSGFEQR